MVIESRGARRSRMLKHPFLPRLLKKVQMQGGKRSVSGDTPLETPESPAGLGRRPEPVELGLRKTRHSERGSVVALGRPVEI